MLLRNYKVPPCKTRAHINGNHQPQKETAQLHKNNPNRNVLATYRNCLGVCKLNTSEWCSRKKPRLASLFSCIKLFAESGISSFKNIAENVVVLAIRMCDTFFPRERHKDIVHEEKLYKKCVSEWTHWDTNTDMHFQTLSTWCRFLPRTDKNISKNSKK